jgi:hypothetical protein
VKSVALVGALLAALATPPTASAATRTYVIAIGNNAPPAGSTLAPLRFADDDSAAFYQFALELAADATLLSVLDAASQRRYPRAAAAARAPTLGELRAVVAHYRDRFAADRARGDDPVLLFFYSGHGQGAPAAALTLADAPLTRTLLYDEILAGLPARYVHLIVDACHAESVVRPRDASAEVVDVAPADARQLAAAETLARFPSVGAIIASAADKQAHEWDAWQSGVFTHELLSGLRGAADINGDGRIEYSELHAFLAAANHEVADARARLDVIVRVPPVNLRAPIVELAARRGGGRLALSDGAFAVENERGERLADAHLERGHRVTLAVPAGERLFVRAHGGEAALVLRDGERRAVAGGALAAAPFSARGALSVSLERGLFAVPFGPAYYRGFVDRVAGLPVPAGVAVETEGGAAGGADAGVRGTGRSPSRTARRRATIALWSGAAALGVVAAVTGGLALDARSRYESTNLQRTADDARRTFANDRTAAAATVAVGGAAAVTALILQLTY